MRGYLKPTGYLWFGRCLESHEGSNSPNAVSFDNRGISNRSIPASAMLN